MDKPKFNLMDGFLIALLVLIVALAAYLFLAPKDSGLDAPRTVTAEYKLELAKYEKVVADEFVAAFENGETLMVGEKERFAAELVDISVTPAKRLITDSSAGAAVLASDPLYYDITLTLRSQVTESNSELLAGSTPLKVGQTTAAKGKTAAGFGYIIKLDIK